MNTLTKCEFIENFSRICIEEKVYPDFVTYNDLGIPLSIAVVAEIADLKNHGKDIIDETFALMCELLELDPNVEYADFDDFMAGSNYEEGTED
jgi:hypothetical protein